MQQETSHNQQYNDEIDLADLVRALWNGKWLVIGVTFVTLLLALAYLMSVPKIYTLSIEISALNSDEASAYNRLDNFERLDLNNSNPYSSHESLQFMPIDGALLFSMMIEDVRSRDSIEQFIKSYDYIEQNKDETDEDFAFRVRTEVYAFAFAPLDLTIGKDSQPNWVLSVTTSHPDIMSQIIADALALSNENVNQQIVKRFKHQQDETARSIRFNIEDLDFKKQRLLSQFELLTTSRLALLQEQAQIARSLDLSNGVLSAQSYAGGPTVVASTLYLRGYLALENEIKMITNRKYPQLFIKELSVLEDLRNQLLHNQTIIRANELLADTPIGTERFIAAHYDLASMQYKARITTKPALALAAVLGGMLGIFILLIRNALIKKD